MPEIYVALGVVMIVAGAICLIALPFILKYHYHIPELILGAVLLIGGITVCAGGEHFKDNQFNYDRDVQACQTDYHHYRKDQALSRHDRFEYHHDKRELARMSGNLHDPKIANMKASQAQDYFNKRRRLQNDVSYFKTDAKSYAMSANTSKIYAEGYLNSIPSRRKRAYVHAHHAAAIRRIREELRK